LYLMYLFTSVVNADRMYLPPAQSATRSTLHRGTVTHFSTHWV
jgi:hypothetical protein